jgi:hypothetical protein
LLAAAADLVQGNQALLPRLPAAVGLLLRQFKSMVPKYASMQGCGWYFDIQNGHKHKDMCASWLDTRGFEQALSSKLQSTTPKAARHK